MNKFAERLRELREENHLSQAGLSKKLNNKITQVAICLWEQNKRIPNIDAVILLAQFFGVSLEYMVGLED